MFIGIHQTHANQRNTCFFARMGGVCRLQINRRIEEELLGGLKFTACRRRRCLCGRPGEGDWQGVTNLAGARQVNFSSAEAEHRGWSLG